MKKLSLGSHMYEIEVGAELTTRSYNGSVSNQSKLWSGISKLSKVSSTEKRMELKHC